MIVYRLQQQNEQTGSWGTVWFAGLTEAKQAFLRAQRIDGQPTHLRLTLDRVEVGPGRAGLVEALNIADVHREAFPGEEVLKS